MSTFVLVHGGWHGGWCWDRVVPLLRRRGHLVLAPDLPGHGAERAPSIDGALPSPSERICDVLRRLDVPAILVGHSSGGMVITDVARHLPHRVRALVYLAAFLLPEGVLPPEVMRHDPESRLPAALVVNEQAGTVTVAPDRVREVFYADCSDEDVAWATERLVPEPLVRGTGAATATARPAGTRTPRIYIETLRDAALGISAQRRMCESMPCERVYSLDTSHSPFLSAPLELAAYLDDVAAQYG